MRKLYLIIFCFLSLDCSSQNSSNILIGGPCEGCEAIFEFGEKSLSAIDTLPDFHLPGPKIVVSGTVFENDGVTPANGVILYVYHTDQNGVYPTKGDEEGWARRHGYIRGWLKTGKDGKYSFYTLKPASYPSRTQPAHIHLTVLEPNGKYYWLGSYFFKGDPLLTPSELNPTNPRGGSVGVIELKSEGNLLRGTRNIILGKNMDSYK